MHRSGKALKEREVIVRDKYSRHSPIGTLRSNDADGNENVTKTIGFISKTTTLQVHHAFLYVSLTVFAGLRREHA